MFARFGLTLAVTSACNLRCRYCYAGVKSNRVMPEHVGRASIDRAIASQRPGGTLELGFFGGEPLLEADLVASLIGYARRQAAAAGMSLTMDMTTNGTVGDSKAWSIMTLTDLNLAISCDGRPAVHDRHRCHPDGTGSSEHVLSTMCRLLSIGKSFRVIVVVRPDTTEFLPEGIEFLQGLGVCEIEPSLDLWTRWTGEDIAALERAVTRCARLWRDGLPECSIGWFDEKAAQLTELTVPPSARCGFGHGEIAVAPSGRLYPCERLIGADADDNPMALSGHAADGKDFLGIGREHDQTEETCDGCAMLSMCNTFCKCSNYARTGDVARPDRLLCAWNQACLNETAKVLGDMAGSTVSNR